MKEVKPISTKEVQKTNKNVKSVKYKGDGVYVIKIKNK